MELKSSGNPDQVPRYLKVERPDFTGQKDALKMKIRFPA